MQIQTNIYERTRQLYHRRDDAIDYKVLFGIVFLITKASFMYSHTFVITNLSHETNNLWNLYTHVQMG